KNDLSALSSLNNDFIISGDHMKPDAELVSEIGDEGVLQVLDRLYDVKKADLLVGKHLSREDSINMNEKDFFEYILITIDELLPIYDIIIGRETEEIKSFIWH